MTGRRKALIIAIDDYEQPELRRLRSAAADAKALGAVLGNPQIGDFEVDVVRNQPNYEIQSRIEDLFSEARADDVLLLHFSGHGLKGEAGDLFFAARNTRPNRLASTAVPADFVQRCVRTSPSRSIVLLLDCCYGGAFSQGVSVRAAGDVHVLESFPSGRLGSGRGRAVISASNAMEFAFEGERLSDDSHPLPSLFTAALVQGLSTGDADRDEDGYVSLNELYEFVFDRVREQNPNQTPSRDIEMQGELYLAKSGRRRLRGTPLPPDLRAATEDANPYTRLGAVSELRSRLLSENLPVAEGAREALLTMAASDTQLVASAASAVLEQLVLRLTPTSLDFGEVPMGTPASSRRVQLAGPPLARHPTVKTSEPWIRVEDTDEAYEISVSPPSVAVRNGTVTFSGAAGDTTLTVRAEGVEASPLQREGSAHKSTPPTPSPGPAPFTPPAQGSPKPIPDQGSVDRVDIIKPMSLDETSRSSRENDAVESSGVSGSGASRSQRWRRSRLILVAFSLVAVGTVVIVIFLVTRQDPQRSYDQLLSHLPSSVATQCTAGDNPPYYFVEPYSADKVTARSSAYCNDYGSYNLWNSAEDAHGYLMSEAGIRAGDCSHAPAPDSHLFQTGTFAGKKATIACGHSMASDFYYVHWAADGVPISSFYSTSTSIDGPTEADYQQIYQKAMSVLSGVH